MANTNGGMNVGGLDLAAMIASIEGELEQGNQAAVVASTAGKSVTELARERALMALRTLGELNGVEEDKITFEGKKFILPETMRGPNWADQATRYIEDFRKAMDAETAFSRTYRFRPNDGAYAFQSAMQIAFGTTGVGQTVHTFFGDYPPEQRSINIGWEQTTQVPWGRFRYEPLKATFTVGGTRDREHGLLFHLEVEGPKMYKREFEAFFDLVGDQLKKHSIYRGKAINGADIPEFINPNVADPRKVVYTEEVADLIKVNIFSLIQHTQEMRDARMPLKRAVLLEGPYGTGKSLAGLLTAQEAVAHGWTFIQVRPGKDDLGEVLKTARIYAPAVVWAEDIETYASADADNEGISEMLDMLDGVTAKGVEILAVFTTNHVEKIQKGAMRPGRLDAVVHIGEMDAIGLRKLVECTVPEGRLDNIDWPQVTEAFREFLPAFASEAIGQAMRFQLARTGKLGLVNTTDLVRAAQGLRRQQELMEGAPSQIKPPALEEAFKRIVADAMNGTMFVDGDGDPILHNAHLDTDEKYEGV